MKCKVFDNKKALSEFVLDIWSYLVFATAMFFFFVVFKLQAATAAERHLTGIANIPISSSTLVNYLRSPVTLDGKETNIAELIRLWVLEPDKYEEILKKASVDVLNNLEYEYENPNAKNIVIRGFSIFINKQKEAENAINPLLELKSKSFEDGFCISDEYGCINLGEQIIPVSTSSRLYVVLRESYKSK